MTSPPAGWYPDPNNPGYERYWGGVEWTSDTRPVDPAPMPPAPGFPPSQQPQPFGVAPAPAPAQASKRSGCGVATGVLIGVVGVLVLVLGGCVALLAVASYDSDGDSVSIATVPRGREVEVTGGSDDDPSEGGVEPTTSEDEASDQSEADELSEADDVLGCTRTAPDEIVLEVVNNSPKTSNYWLTVGFYDDAGTRLADEAAFLNDLRPGERAIEAQLTFEEQGTVCEVIDVDRFANESDADVVAEVGACEITGKDFFGDFAASVSVTNSSSQTSDYNISVAFIDPDGIRRGHGNVFIEAVRAGETAPGEAFTTLAFVDGYVCEVVNTVRTAS
jgi:hypothetical protein